MNKTLREKIFPNGNLIKLIEGDITLVEVEAITNPANAQLNHGGGLAGTLSRKAGPSLQQESRQWIQDHGPVSHGAPAHTGAGDLPFKAVIHAVGPVWGSGNEDQKLSAAVLGALNLADSLKLVSVALPAISTGIFGFPLERAARITLSTMIDFCSNETARTLSEIQLVIYDHQSALVVRRIWDEDLP